VNRTGPALVLAMALLTSACVGDPQPGAPDVASSPRPSDSAAAAAAFAEYAAGGATAVPWAEQVTFSLAGEEIATFDSGDAGRRRAWSGCPADVTTYEERSCPVSALEPVRRLVRDGGEVSIEREAPATVGCNRAAPLQDGKAASVVWIRPDDAHRDCFSDFSLTIYLDAADRVRNVDLVLSGP
jgi:hypothetical protein